MYNTWEFNFLIYFLEIKQYCLIIDFVSFKLTQKFVITKGIKVIKFLQVVGMNFLWNLKFLC